MGRGQGSALSQAMGRPRSASLAQSPGSLEGHEGSSHAPKRHCGILRAATSSLCQTRCVRLRTKQSLG